MRGSHPSPSHPHHFLQKHHREHHHQLHLGVVRQLCRKNNLDFSSFHPGHFYWKLCLSQARDIIRDCTHPHHERFSLLISGRRYCSARSRTARFCKFHPAGNDTFELSVDTTTLVHSTHLTMLSIKCWILLTQFTSIICLLLKSVCTSALHNCCVLYLLNYVIIYMTIYSFLSKFIFCLHLNDNKLSDCNIIINS